MSFRKPSGGLETADPLLTMEVSESGLGATGQKPPAKHGFIGNVDGQRVRAKAIVMFAKCSQASW